MNQNEIRKIENTSKVEKIYETLEQMIIDGELKPGDKIPSEPELSASFGVSRATVRQVVERLRQTGLIETIHGKGSFVLRPGAENSMRFLIPAACLDENTLSNVNEFRLMIETFSITSACRKASEEDLSELAAICDGIDAAVKKKDISEYIRYDRLFHRGIVKSTENPLINESYEIIDSLIEKSMNIINVKMNFEGAQYHRQILTALIGRDAEKAGALMKEHLEKNQMYITDGK